MLAEALDAKLGLVKALCAQGAWDPAIAEQIDQLEDKSDYIKLLPRNGNLLGLGFGMKETNGEVVPDSKAILVYVKGKSRLPPVIESIPPFVNGIETDVVQLAHASYLGITPHTLDNLVCTRERPCHGGSSISRNDVHGGTGTVGCVVRRNGTEELHILSCAHVLSKVVEEDDDFRLLQPAFSHLDQPEDEAHILATLTHTEPIDLENVNVADAAIGRVISASEVATHIREIGHINPDSVLPVIGTQVQKFGSGTAHTQGVVTSMAVDLFVCYRADQHYAAFKNQIAVTAIGSHQNFCGPGDSGALVVDMTNRPLGLLFGSAIGLTFCSPIDVVLNLPAFENGLALVV